MRIATKILTITLLSLTSLFAAENSQPAKVGLGARAAFNYSFMYGLSDDWNVYADDSDAPSGIGFEIGIGARLQMLPFMQFTPELLFNYANLTQDDGDMDREFSQMGIELPLLLRITPMNKIYIAIGPNIEFNISDDAHINSGEMTIAGSTYHHEFPESYERNTVQFGLTFGFGYYVIDNLSVDARINLGLNEVYDGESLLISLKDGKQMSFKFGIGYWFM